MSSASSSHRRSFRAFALVALIAAAPSACLDLGGLTPDSATGTGGASSTSSAGGAGGVDVTTSTTTSTTTSGASSSSGGPTDCMPGTIEPCAYSGPAGTVDKGLCKAGQHTCQSDGMSFDACKGEVLPAVENCAKPADEDCNGAAPACTGTTQGGAGFEGTLSNNDEVTFAVATDKAGNIVLGGVENTTPSGPLGYSIYSGDGVVTKLSPTGTKLWSTHITTGTGGYSIVRGVATNTAGDVFIVGEYQGAIAGTGFTLPMADVVDIFLMKLDATTGAPVWQKRFTGPDGQYPSAISLDTNGNIFLTGATYGSVDFGGGPKSKGGGSDLFVVKLDKDGKHLWSSAFGDASGQVGYGVAATPEGDVVVAGLLGGNMDFGGGKNANTAGGEDVFVAKLKGDTGVALWAHQYGDNSNQHANGVAVSSDGSVVLTGQMVGKCNFGGGDLNAKGNSDVFVAKLDAGGNYKWGHNYGNDPDNQVGLGVTIDPAQNIVVVGYLKGTMPFGATTLTEAPSSPSQSTDMFVAKLAADGNAVWARSFGDTNDQAAWAVTTDASANVIVVGGFQGKMDFMPPSITSTGNYDSFWLKLAP